MTMKKLLLAISLVSLLGFGGLAGGTHTITPSQVGPGIVEPYGVSTVTDGANLTYTIIPGGQHHIVDVLVDGSSVGPVTSYTFTNVTSDHTIHAIFEIDTYPCTASAGPHGTISPSGTVMVNSGADFCYTITPDLGYHIQAVVQDGYTVLPRQCDEVWTNCIPRVYEPHTVSVTFQACILTITATCGTYGSINPSYYVSVNYGASQAFTITPNDHYHVATLTVDGSSVTPATSYTFANVTRDHTISAGFAVDTYTISASAGANGSITPSGSVSVNSGQNQTFTITPNAHYHVATLTVDGSPVTPVTSFTFTHVTTSHTISATFAIDTNTIAASAGANGSISPSGSVSVNYGASQAFTITPTAHYHVADVLVDGSSAGAVTSYTFTNVTASHTISASFAIDTFTITASAGANGSITPSGSVSVNYGASQAFSITPTAHYHVADVLVDGSSVGPVMSYTFTNITASHTIAANFAIDTFTITASAGANGSISPSGSVSVNYGSSQGFSITPAAHYHVADVLVDGSSVGAVTSYTFTSVTAAHSISASFAVDPDNQCSLSVLIVGNGTVTASPDYTTYDCGTVVSLTANPSVGCTFAGWSGDAMGKANPLRVTVEGSKDITVTFQDIIPPVTQFTSVPPDPSNTPNPAFAWAGTDNVTQRTNLLFSENLDSMGWTEWGLSTSTVLGPQTEGRHAFQVRARDEAGNVESTASYTWYIDLTAPWVFLETPSDLATYKLASVLVANWSASDNHSPVLTTATVPSGTAIDTSTMGMFDFTVTATDAAGNSTTRTASYFVAPTLIPGQGVAAVVTAAGAACSEKTCSFLTKPVPTTADAAGDVMALPVPYTIGEAIDLEFTLNDAHGLPITDAHCTVQLYQIDATGDGETLVLLQTFDAPYDTTKAGYLTAIATGALAPGKYELRLVGNGTVIIRTVRIQLS